MRVLVVAANQEHKPDPVVPLGAAYVAGAAREMSWAEVVAVVTGVACVLLTVRQNVWCWPVGMVSSGLFIWVFAQARLYPDALLQICFILISVYGWYRWARGVQQADLPVSRLGLPACLMFVMLGLAFTAGIGWFFASALPQGVFSEVGRGKLRRHPRNAASIG